MPKKMKWKRFRPDSDPLLETLLDNERRLTLHWYTRMAGEVEWAKGEKGDLERGSERVAAQINALISKDAAKRFAEMLES